MASVLITGGSGLLGRHTRAAWPSSLETTVVDHAIDDLLVPGAFSRLIEKERPDAVLHLAWSASSTPGYRSSAANAQWQTASLSAAQTCLDLGIRFLATGTVVDDDPAGDAYTASKASLKATLAPAIAAGDITWMRPHYVFDPEQPSPAVLRDARVALETGRPVELSTPAASHDFVHAADVGRAVVSCVVNNLSGTVDIGSGQLRTVSALVEAYGAKWIAANIPTPDRPFGLGADIAPLRATGWLPSDTEGYFAHD